MFIEEPALPGDVGALREVARSTVIPVAAGERLFTRWQFADVIEARAVSVVQPDLSHAGGVMESRKIAAMAEARNVALAPHCPLGPVSLAACLQLDAVSPNFLCQEYFPNVTQYVKGDALEVRDGYIPVPEELGLGIELDHDAVEAGRFEGNWETPNWRLEDGSFAEW
jgi:galactonate dehydratase